MGTNPTTEEQPPSDTEPPIEDFDADALVERLGRNARWALGIILAIVSVGWREPMAVLGAALGGAMMLLNFQLLERLVAAALGSGQSSPSPVQLGFLAFRLVLMALLLCGIFLLPGIHPIPVALGLSVLVFAVLVETFSDVLSGPSSRP